MTPADEATFITLWQQGASYRAIAQALGCALGSVGYRAAALVAQGKIQARPKGGAYPTQRRQAVSLFLTRFQRLPDSPISGVL